MSSVLDTAAMQGSTPRSRRGDPPWELADEYPRQGAWTEADYLALDTNRLIEFCDGELEFPPIPDFVHQVLVGTIYEQLNRHVRARRLGRALPAGFRVRLRPGKYREPDVLFLANDRVFNAKYSEGADLVVEVLSSGDENRRRVQVDKRADYAEAGVAEYWLVDPENQTFTVLCLDDATYRVHGEFRRGEVVTSPMLKDFQLDVGETFAAAEA